MDVDGGVAVDVWRCMRLRQNEGRAASDVNPTLQLTWPEAHWTSFKTARDTFCNAVSEAPDPLSGEFPLQAVYKGSRASDEQG